MGKSHNLKQSISRLKKHVLRVQNQISKGLLVWECLRRNEEYIQAYKSSKPFFLHETGSNRDKMLSGQKLYDPKLTKNHFEKLFEGLLEPITECSGKQFLSAFQEFAKHEQDKQYIDFYLFISFAIGAEPVIDSYGHIEGWELFAEKGDLGSLNIPDYEKYAVKQETIKAEKSLPYLNGNLYGAVSKSKMTQEDFLYEDYALKLPKDTLEELVKSVPEKINITVDLTFSKEEILEEVERTVDDWLQYLEKYGKRNTRKKIDSDCIEQYLRVFDIKSSSEKTFEDLADELYPRKNFESAVQQVKREYKRAKELINGDYKYLK